MTFPAGRIFVSALMLVLAIGCFRLPESSLNEEKDPHFMEGKKKVNSMDYEGAIESFERALQANPRSAAAHMELGLLYEQRKRDYLTAAFHYQRHLELNPKSSMADVVNDRITFCKRELAKSVSVALVSREVQRDLERLTLTNNMLRERMLALEAELNRRPQYITNFVTNWLTVTQTVTRTVEAPAREVAEERDTRQVPVASSPRAQANTTRRQTPPPAVNRPTRTPAPQPTRVHVVRSGDTLAKLSRQYGVSIDALKRANPRISPNKILVGQRIVIPER